MCFPGRKTHITRDMCLPGRKTHITRDMCLPGRGTHITRDMCFPGICVFQVGEYIRICFSQVGEHISLGICVSQVGKVFQKKRTCRAGLKQSLFLFLFYNFFNRPFFCYFSIIYRRQKSQSSRR